MLDTLEGQNRSSFLGDEHNIRYGWKAALYFVSLQPTRETKPACFYRKYADDCL